MDSVTTVVSDFNSRYSDVSSASAERLFNMIHKRILARLGLRDTTATISLTAGTREYDLAEANLQIRVAHYVRSANDGDFYELRETSTDALDELDEGWRGRADRSEPHCFYVRSVVDADTSEKQIGFVELPPTTTSGGYPNVTLYVTQNAVLSGSDTIPAALQDSQIYLDGMSWLFAKEQGLESRDYWKAEYEKRCHEEMAFIKRMARKDPTIYFPSWVRSKSVV